MKIEFSRLSEFEETSSIATDLGIHAAHEALSTLDRVVTSAPPGTATMVAIIGTAMLRHLLDQMDDAMDAASENSGFKFSRVTADLQEALANSPPAKDLREKLAGAAEGLR